MIEKPLLSEVEAGLFASVFNETTTSIGEEFISTVENISSMSWGKVDDVGLFCKAAMKSQGVNDVYDLPLGVVFGIMSLSCSIVDRVPSDVVFSSIDYWEKRKGC